MDCFVKTQFLCVYMKRLVKLKSSWAMVGIDVYFAFLDVSANQ